MTETLQQLAQVVKNENLRLGLLQGQVFKSPPMPEPKKDRKTYMREYMRRKRKK